MFFTFAQLDLIAVSLTPCALGQSCFSRATYAHQSIICGADKTLHFEPILLSEKTGASRVVKNTALSLIPLVTPGFI